MQADAIELDAKCTEAVEAYLGSKLPTPLVIAKNVKFFLIKCTQPNAVCTKFVLGAPGEHSFQSKITSSQFLNRLLPVLSRCHSFQVRVEVVCELSGPSADCLYIPFQQWAEAL
jgi:hypothetical protein